MHACAGDGLYGRPAGLHTAEPLRAATHASRPVLQRLCTFELHSAFAFARQKSDAVGNG